MIFTDSYAHKIYYLDWLDYAVFYTLSPRLCYIGPDGWSWGQLWFEEESSCINNRIQRQFNALSHALRSNIVSTYSAPSSPPPIPKVACFLSMAKALLWLEILQRIIDSWQMIRQWNWIYCSPLSSWFPLSVRLEHTTWSSSHWALGIKRGVNEFL